MRLNKIFNDDATAKAIVFVQWRDLEDKVAAVLSTHKIKFLRLPHKMAITLGYIKMKPVGVCVCVCGLRVCAWV